MDIEKLDMNFAAREVLSHEKLQRIPDKVDEIIDEVNGVIAEVFPLTAAYTEHNAATTEVGVTVTPVAEFSITRKGVDVSNTAEVSVVRVGGGEGEVTISQDKKGYSASAITDSGVSYKVVISQRGQQIELPTLSWNKSYYRYKGVLDDIPTDYATVIKSLGKELSTTATLGSTNLSANKYYLFAVKGTHSLVCRHASTDGIVNGCVTGTEQIGLECDNSVKNVYSYILIPASTSVWNFKITNL